MDTQTVHTSVNAPRETTGLDPGKKSRGRKRGIATDVLGLLIGVIVVAASVHDNAIGITLLDQVAADNPSVTKGWVDAGFKNAVIDHGAALGIDVEVVRRDPDTKGFAPAPKRWIVEQTFGTLMPHRRPAREYETPPASSASWIRWSMPGVMTRRLTAATTLTWRDPPPAQSLGPARTSGGEHAPVPGADRAT
jgi:transposase